MRVEGVERVGKQKEHPHREKYNSEEFIEFEYYDYCYPSMGRADIVENVILSTRPLNLLRGNADQILLGTPENALYKAATLDNDTECN